MSKKETDISLIRKYLNGDLDARAMHLLERRAQDDPFLMDAIEGYETIKSDQQPQFDDLNTRLQQRITRKEARIIPWRIITIAASVLVVFTIGGVVLYNNRQPAIIKIAQQGRPQVKQDAVTTAPDSVIADKQIAVLSPPVKRKYYAKVAPVISADKIVESAPPPAADQIANADASMAEPESIDTESTSLSEMVVLDMNKKDRVASRSKMADTLKRNTILNQSNINTPLLGKVSGVMVNPAEGKPMPGYFNPSLSMRVTGRIIDKIDGQPMPGVSVRVAGTSKGTMTDSNGQFKLTVDSPKTKLNIGFIGYESVNVNVNKRDSVKTISMVPNHSSLNEVVVVGYGTKKADDESAPIIDAHPKDGWSSFRKYLKEHAKSPDGKMGIVKLSFMVDNYGQISDIKVTKGLSSVADQKAIDLVNDSLTWVGSSTGQTEKVTIRIKFNN